MPCCGLIRYLSDQVIKQRIQEKTGGLVPMSFKFLKAALMSIVNSYLKDYLLSYIYLLAASPLAACEELWIVDPPILAPSALGNRLLVQNRESVWEIQREKDRSRNNERKILAHCNFIFTYVA